MTWTTERSMQMDKVKRIAYWIWRALPPGSDLDDVTSEAVLGALRARPDCEVIAAKRAIFDYLRRCNPGSRGTGKMCLRTVWWLPTGEAEQERLVITEELRRQLMAAVDLLTVKELAVIQAVFWQDTSQHEAAREMGMTEAYFSRVKHRALAKLREAIA